jgi:aminoglycoside phosphotransferase (APT) family kinase protein
MLLDERTAVPILRTAGLACQSVASVVDRSSRNRVIAVKLEDGTGYLVKQAAWREDAHDLAHEAAVIRELNALGFPRAPTLHWHDPGAAVLVVDLLVGATTMRSSLPAGGKSGEDGEALGRAVAELHALPAADAPRREPPWVLRAHRPRPVDFRTLSVGNRALLSAVQRAAGVSTGLALLRWHWSHDTFVHGDLRLDNCMVVPDRGAALVDWERGGAGDARWDLGAVLGDQLWRWLDDPAVTLEDVRAFSTGFWNEYIQRARNRGALRVDAVRFAAARLIEGLFERTVWSDAVSAQDWRGLRLAANVLARPSAAADELFGMRDGS